MTPKTANSSLRPLLFVVAIGLLVAATACGGGDPQPSQPVTISISPSSASVQVAKTQQFGATVGNTANTAASWQVNGTSGGNSTVGTISTSGLYTAPATVPSPAAVSVTAVAQADATKSASAQVTITAPSSNPPVFTSSAPTTASEGVQYSYSITATDPSNTSVTYAIVSGPTGAAIAENVLRWIPEQSQSRTMNDFKIQATTGGGGTATQSWTVATSGTVRGEQYVYYFAESAMDLRNITSNLAGVNIAALAPDNSGGFTTIAGTGLADGTFTIPSVPPGYYWLKADQNYYWTDNSFTFLNRIEAGRFDKVINSIPTDITFSFWGITPFSGYDTVQYFVPNTGLYQWFPIASGVTSWIGEFSWRHALSDASKGDVGYVSLLTSRTWPTSHLALIRVLNPSPVSITERDGGGSLIFGSLDYKGQDKSLRLNVKGTAFAQLHSAVNPSTVPGGRTSIGLCATPYVSPIPEERVWIKGKDGRIVESVPYLVYADLAPITSDADFGDLWYYNPYPGWRVVLSYSDKLVVSIKAPGATNPMQVNASIVLETGALPSATSPLQPLLGPVQSPTISAWVVRPDVQGWVSKDFFSEVTGLGLTPTLSWQAPSVGTANGYQVSVYRLWADAGGASRSELKATLITTTTGVQVPPGILEAGNSYYFFITALYGEGDHYNLYPYIIHYPRAFADAVSGVVTP